MNRDSAHLAVDLPDGGHLRIRPVRPEDKALLSEGFERMSARNRRMRFFVPLQHLTEPMLAAMTELDHHDSFAWVALACEGDHEALAGVARYSRLSDDPSTAEVALTVIDRYQHRGIGRLLLDALVLEGHAAGITRFTGELLGDNQAIRAVLADSGAQLHFAGRGTFSFDVEVAARADALRDHPVYEQLHRLAM